MALLIERGRAELRAYLSARLAHDPDPLRREAAIGTAASLHVVTHADFIANAELCLEHAVDNNMATHILWKNGSLYALVEKRTGSW